jgi:hypothetical protein
MFISHKNIDCDAEITIQVAHANPQSKLSCIKTHSPTAKQSGWWQCVFEYYNVTNMSKLTIMETPHKIIQ